MSIVFEASEGKAARLEATAAHVTVSTAEEQVPAGGSVVLSTAPVGAA